MHTTRMPVFAAIAVFSMFVFISLTNAQTTAKPVFSSKIVTGEQGNPVAKIDANISGAQDLYLVATDGGNGYSFDWCNWIKPQLVGGDQRLSLTKLKWKSATSDWGSVQLNKNCNGTPLTVNGKEFATGIGTHANSVIHFQLPKNHKFQKLTALAGLDDGGTNQGNGHTASVQFFVYTQKPPQFASAPRNTSTSSSTDHELEKVLTQFDVHPELDISLFAAEPMLVNPTNIDIDHLGRVWVCEVVNYRGKRNQRKAGDRILVLEDTNANGKADKQHIFYQGRDIDSIHGICILGDRALISAGSQVFYLIDTDGDLKADKKEILFTKISGVQHDHGIHAFVFGPDGKLYFNFGNSGRQICDKNGKPIIDVAGQIVSDRSKPYKQGMVFRCNLDGSEFETLAWNFRNNWEVCVDSFGRMWQSDNDDDGNRGVRINYVMQYGNFGYLDEMTGAGWRSPRTGMAKEIPLRHWHLNDPGVVPNLLQTGGGSPTGICFYEGDALPKIFQNQILHCDAGPSIVRAYPIKADGAGYRASIVNIMDGAKHNKWFRPSDVCVAPDGSLIVADWYDPGVGGHGMGDIERGRLFRVTAKGKAGKYVVAKADISTPENAAQALASPNLATRYLAWTALQNFGEKSEASLYKMLNSKNDFMAARALWMLTKIGLSDEAVEKYLLAAFELRTPLIKETAVKALCQVRNKKLFNSIWSKILASKTWLPDNVLREVLIAQSKRQKHKNDLTGRRGDLRFIFTACERINKNTARANTRWLIEAVGIAAENQWDTVAYWTFFQKVHPEHPQPPIAWAPPDVIWRSRSKKTPEYLAGIILDSKTDAESCLKYFRAFDFQDQEYAQPVLAGLAFETKVVDVAKQAAIRREAIRRVQVLDLSGKRRDIVVNLIDDPKMNVDDVLMLISRFSIDSRYAKLIDIAIDHANDQAGRRAIELLYRKQQRSLIRESIVDAKDETFEPLLNVVSNTPVKGSAGVLAGYATNNNHPIERRKLATRYLGRLRGGCETLIAWAEKNEYDPQLKPALVAALHGARWRDINVRAAKLFPLPPSKGDKPLPKVADLVRRRGNPKNGQAVFHSSGTCATCHQVNGLGKPVGPELSEIGKKLSRQAMFESILFPSASISHNYEMWRVTTIDGEMIDGVLVSSTDRETELIDAKGKRFVIKAADIDEKEKQKVSIMPADLHKSITEQELVDVVDYMMSLNKADQRRQARIKATKANIEILRRATKAFRLDTSVWPQSTQQLMDKKQIKDERIAQRWRGPYLSGRPKDAWGTDFRITVAKAKKSAPPEMRSAGPDKKFDTFDDVGSSN